MVFAAVASNQHHRPKKSAVIAALFGGGAGDCSPPEALFQLKQTVALSIFFVFLPAITNRRADKPQQNHPPVLQYCFFCCFNHFHVGFENSGCKVQITSVSFC